MNIKSIALWALWIAAAVLGMIGLVGRIVYGDRLTALTSYIPWGIWVAGYIYFIGLSAGSFLLSSLVYVFGVHQLERIAKLALYIAIVTLVMALTTILFDLGHMNRFYEVFLRPQFHSMMAWMVWLYTSYFLLVLAEIIVAIRMDRPECSQAERSRDGRTLQILGAIGIPLAFAFHGGVGALFATVVAREYWHTAINPLIFLSGAFLSGGALMTAIVAFMWPTRDAQWVEMLRYLGKVVLGLILLDTLLEWAEFSTAMWYGIGSEVALMQRVLFGHFWYVFWIVHILLGVVVPLALLAWALWGRQIWQIGLASLLVAVTFFAVRLDIVIPGLITPELRGLEHAYLSDRLSYSYVPNFFEWEILIGVVALGMALFYVGLRILPLGFHNDTPLAQMEKLS